MNTLQNAADLFLQKAGSRPAVAVSSGQMKNMNRHIEAEST